MCCAVHQPSLIESETKTKQSGNEKSVQKRFVPQIHWNDGRQDETRDEYKWDVVPERKIKNYK